MKASKQKNYAFIDSQNLNLSIQRLGWKLDFHCLVHYLSQQDKLEKVIIPDRNNYSALLKKFATKLAFLNDLQIKLEYNKKHPVRTKP